MEIVNPCFSALSNYEVMESLKTLKDTKKKQGLRNLATITYESLQYLEDSPCKQQSRETIHAFLTKVRQLTCKLTTTECLMIVNDPPTSALHIQLLIEDSEERLTEEQVNELLQIVARHFPNISSENS
ncbi:DNA-directed RNA polymerase III subunit RPC9 [Anastrepha ludens]|uniref:DNA-directed RNA polymerase III subunit RPC9 n=1 Tax=Anastrepha ludens TaxID=28586 RepID=UPI0023AEAC61|nr:DNA-directed RNA polymerase III subunit RPC9 [Anastrepha ludens]